jgi:hypothetical protein
MLTVREHLGSPERAQLGRFRGIVIDRFGCDEHVG